jgi:hypothetical protein
LEDTSISMEESVLEGGYGNSRILSNGTLNALDQSSFNLVHKHFVDEFAAANSVDAKIYTPISFRSKALQAYLDEFQTIHQQYLTGRSSQVQEMFMLYQSARAFQIYNEKILNLPYTEFRAKFYFPNIVYLLVRFFPNARKFIQTTIQKVYRNIQTKNSSIINLYENSIYLDKEVIKSDVLYNFLGNMIKRMNPLDVKNIPGFYYKAVSNIFFYYFKSEQKIKSSWSSFWELEGSLSSIAQVPTRDVIYRDVLTHLQIDEYREFSPTLRQVHYNYAVFKNVIMNNEFQNVYFTSFDSNETGKNELRDNQYKILSLYSDITDREENDEEQTLEEIKKLPTIYKLLKSVHIVSKTKTVTNQKVSTDVLRVAVLEELLSPFKNLISASYIKPILENIARNFANSILSGEYINIMTLAPIAIEQATFITQVRKFIQICIYGKPKRI